MEDEWSLDTSAAAKGSEPLSGIGINMQAAHSTVMIKVSSSPMAYVVFLVSNTL